MAHLILQKKDSQDKIFKLTKSTTTLGRRSKSDVFLTDKSVSRDHAEIIALEDGGYEIQDVGVMHPIMVNGTIISRHRLRDGDKIKLGDFILIFRSKEPCSTAQIEFLAPEDMSQEAVEVASVDAKKTKLFSADDMDLVSLQRDHQRLMLLCEFGKTINLLMEDAHHLLDEILSASFRTLDAERDFIALVDENTGNHGQLCSYPQRID